MTASAALAAPAGETTMPLGRAAPAPAGYVAFCARQPKQCDLTQAPSARLGENVAAETTQVSAWAPAATRNPGLASAGAAFAAQLAARPAVNIAATASAGPAFGLTDETWKSIKRINSGINRAMRATTDQVAFGIADYWDMPLAAGRRTGDCEDFVLEKRRALIEAGVPPQALNIGLVLTRRNEPHAVLVLTTAQGDFVLDNLNPRVEAWNRTGYDWLARQVDGVAATWRFVENRPATMAPPAPPAPVSPVPAEGLRVALVSAAAPL